MCELLAVSASEPVDVKLSFGRLAAHGGSGGQPDGWGVAFLDGTDARIWRDPHAAAVSPWVACLAEHPVASSLVVAHIRRATRGGLSLANTQPFMRELFGCVHVFAHNGTLSEIEPIHRPVRFEPLGETDSELAFCAMLEAIATCDGTPISICSTFAEQARRLRSLGPANLLYASGDRLLVHSDRRTQASGTIAPPGLWLLERSCQPSSAHVDGRAGVELTGTAVRVIIVASVPLTEEAWRPLDRGTVVEIARGIIVAEHCLDQSC
jgi:predicted glutamine amidotransferase